MKKIYSSLIALTLSAFAGGSSAFAQATIDVDKTALVKTEQAAWIGATEMPGESFTTADGRTTKVAAVYKEKPEAHEDVPLKQVVTGLENGTYTVELHGKVQTANWNYTVPEDFVPGSGYAQVYAISGDSKVVDPIEAVLDKGWVDFQWHTMDVTVTDGTLELGLELLGEKNYVNWLHIQIKSLTWHTTTAELLASEIAALTAKIEEAKAVENPTADLVAAIAAAESVLETATTAEELQAAIAALTKAIAMDAKVKLVAGATPFDPVETDFVVNGTFDSKGVTAPWKTTTGAQNQTTANNQQGAFTGNFFENWNPSAFAGKMYQTVSEIPNGTYKLSICAFVNTLADPTNCQYVYANEDKTYLTTGAPTAYEVYTVVTDNQVEIGLEQTEAVANWIGIDNVKLFYCGEGDVKNAAENAGAIMLVKNAYDEALAKVSTLDAAGQAKFEELTASIKTAIEEGLITKENCDELVAALNAAVLEAVAAQTTPGSDMTLLIVNAAVANETGWTNYRGNAGEQYEGAPDNTYMDEWSGGEHTREITQVITLPKGVYTLMAATRGANVDATTGYILASVGEKLYSTPINKDGNQGGDLGNGWSWTTVDDIVVPEAGEVTIGAHFEVNNSWAGADDFHLFLKDILTGISTVNETSAAKNGKFLSNGRIVIVKNGQKYNVAGQAIK